jgi:4-hydroxy-tetrahydrodipicolinate synthase
VTGEANPLGEVITAIVTPFRPDGALALDRFQELARHLVANGSDGLVVCGTTGESPTLSDDEKLALFAAAVDAVGDRASVIAGTGTYSTSHSVELTEQAHELGVDGFLVVYPYYSKPPMRGFVEHVRAIAAVTDKPIVIYNIPLRTVTGIDTPTFAELAEIPNVTAVKQAHDDMEQARAIVELGLALYAGDDAILLPHLDLGGRGVVSVTAHVAGPQTKQLVEAFRAGDRDRAEALNRELEPVFELLKVQVNPIPIKAALNLLGHEVGGHRLPLVEANDDEVAAVRDCLERLGVLEPAAA